MLKLSLLPTSLRAQQKILLDQLSTLDQMVEYWERCVCDEGKEVVALIRQKRRQEMKQKRNSHVKSAADEPERANRPSGLLAHTGQL